MDINELHEGGHRLLDCIKSRVDEPNWESAYSLLFHGEEGEFADLLLAMIIHQEVTLRQDEFSLLSDLVASFSVTEHDRDVYRYLADPEILDRIPVAEDDTRNP